MAKELLVQGLDGVLGPILGDNSYVLSQVVLVEGLLSHILLDVRGLGFHDSIHLKREIPLVSGHRPIRSLGGGGQRPQSQVHWHCNT